MTGARLIRARLQRPQLSRMTGWLIATMAVVRSAVRSHEATGLGGDDDGGGSPRRRYVRVRGAIGVCPGR